MSHAVARPQSQIPTRWGREAVQSTACRTLRTLAPDLLTRYNLHACCYWTLDRCHRPQFNQVLEGPPPKRKEPWVFLEPALQDAYVRHRDGQLCSASASGPSKGPSGVLLLCFPIREYYHREECSSSQFIDSVVGSW